MIELNHLTFQYRKAPALFQDLSISLPAGHVYGVLGKNGVGKTSLLKIIAGLLFSKSEQCTVMNRQPQQRQVEFLQSLYFVADESFVPAVTASRYMNMYAPFYPQFDSVFFTQCCTEFELSMQSLLTEFSHGQKKKFLIAFALATRCPLLILDEPTNGLDIPSKAQFKKLLAAAITDQQLVLISTHQVYDVKNLIDAVLILEGGKAVINATLTELSQRFTFSHQLHEPEVGSCLYYEKQLGGYIVVTHNTSGIESEIDLEILFNFITHQK